MDHPYKITISVQRIERRIELLKIHSNLSYDGVSTIISRYARYRIKESFPGKLSRKTSPNFLSSTSTKLGARFLRGEKKKRETRELIFTAIPPYLLSSEVLIESWDKGHAFPRRHVTRLSRKVYPPRGWRVEREKRKKEWEREKGRVQAGYRKLLLFYQPTVSTGETRSNGIKKPLRDRDCSRLTVSHPSPYPRSSHHHPLDSDQSDRSTATAMMTLLSFPATPLTRSDFLSAWKRRVSSGKTML